MSTAIKVENLSKAYQIGQIGTGTITKDFERWWTTKVRGKEDPFLKIGETNDQLTKGISNMVWSLKDINFEVQQGDAVGIIGRNGAGKSTLLKILSEVTSPTTGKINIKGRVASLLEVGTGFHPELTGRENIFLNGAILGMRKKEIQRKLDQIIDFSGVERYVDTPVKRYSSGMYVRLAFAVAAHLESEILIVDEVLAVGDAEFQKKCLGKMGQVSRGEGRTVLFVSHNMAAVTSLCNKCVLLKNGTLEEAGLTTHIIDKYIMSGKSFEGEILEEDIKYDQRYEWARFKAIRTTGSRGMTNSFGINEAIDVELEYEILRDGEMIQPSIHVLDNLGNCILASFNGNSANTAIDPLFGKPFNKGIYKTVCTIPAFFLNDISYLVSCFLVPKVTSEMAIVNEALNLSIHETGEMRTEFNGPWIGLIRPKLHWITTKLF
jgi:lipopolysaccharide transport system ATP-binding protein